jgi:hypothetical protein
MPSSKLTSSDFKQQAQRWLEPLREPTHPAVLIGRLDYLRGFFNPYGQPPSTRYIYVKAWHTESFDHREAVRGHHV